MVDTIRVNAKIKAVAFKEDKEGGDPTAEIRLSVEFHSDLFRLARQTGKSIQLIFVPLQMELPLATEAELPRDFARVYPG
jgi:hypothetical protein